MNHIAKINISRVMMLFRFPIWLWQEALCVDRREASHRVSLLRSLISIILKCNPSQLKKAARIFNGSNHIIECDTNSWRNGSQWITEQKFIDNLNRCFWKVIQFEQHAKKPRYSEVLKVTIEVCTTPGSISDSGRLCWTLKLSYEDTKLRLHVAGLWFSVKSYWKMDYGLNQFSYVSTNRVDTHQSLYF